MATLALAAVRTLRKLAFMRIGFMAVCAEIMRNRRLEIAVCVALNASDLQVLSLQSEVRLCVIEGDSKRRLLPRRSRMARIASLFERSLMRVDTVAISTIGKRQSCVLRLTVICGSMAALAQDVSMFAS